MSLRTAYVPQWTSSGSLIVIQKLSYKHLRLWQSLLLIKSLNNLEMDLKLYPLGITFSGDDTMASARQQTEIQSKIQLKSI